MARTPRFGPGECRELADRHAAGAAVTRLAEEHRANPETIKKAIERGGGTVRVRPPPAPTLREADHAEVVRLYRSGMRVMDLKRRFRTKQKNIAAVLDAAGVPRHRRGPKPSLTSDEQAAAYFARRRRGESTAALAAEAGMLPGTFAEAMKRRGYRLSDARPTRP